MIRPAGKGGGFSKSSSPHAKQFNRLRDAYEVCKDAFIMTHIRRHIRTHIRRHIRTHIRTHVRTHVRINARNLIVSVMLMRYVRTHLS